ATAGDTTIRLWNTRTGKELRRFTALGRSFSFVAYSTDGKLVAAPSNHAVCLWDTGSGTPLLDRDGHREQISSLHFTRDSKTLISVDRRDEIRSWDRVTGEQARRHDPVPAMGTLVIAPDG